MKHESITTIEDTLKAVSNIYKGDPNRKVMDAIRHGMATQWSGFFAGRTVRTSNGNYYVVHRVELDERNKCTVVGVKIGDSGKIVGNEVSVHPDFVIMHEGL